VEVLPTDLPGVLLIQPRVFTDQRGCFLEVFQNERYCAARIAAPFVQSNCARSLQGVLRGLHYQLAKPQGKLIWVSSGAVFDVAVDLRTGSPDFGRWTGAVLSSENRTQMYIPPGFAHGYCVLSDIADVMYQCTDYYHPQSEQTLIWNDSRVGIEWPVADPVLSLKDSAGLTLAESPCYEQM